MEANGGAGAPVLRISASLLSCDFARLAEEAAAVLAAGADWLHVDVMDGAFVADITVGPPVVRALRAHFPRPACSAFFDCHLMVARPAQFVEPMSRAGASSYTFHVEAVEGGVDGAGARDLARRVREAGMRAGVALRPDTPVDAVLQLAADRAVDLVLVMTVDPGRPGQAFRAETIPKVRAVRAAAPPAVDVQVDGGITPDTARAVAAAGANVLVAGSAIFRGGPDTYAAVIHDMRAAAQEARR